MHLTDWEERVDLQKEINEVYVHTFLFKLATNLVTIFLPLYILNLNYGISAVISFFMVYSLAFAIFSLPNAFIASKIGYKHCSLLSSPLILVFYFMLRGSSSLGMLFGSAFLGGFAFNLYWLGMNPEIATSSHDGDRDKETGIFFSMPTLAAIIAPVVGGLISTQYGFDLTFAVAGLIAFTSFFPFIFSKEHKDGMELEFKSFLNRDFEFDMLTYITKEFPSKTKKVIWPLYLAIILESATTIGGVGSLMALGGAVTSMSIGKISRPENRNRIIAVAGIISALTFLLMVYATSPGIAMMLSLANGLAFTAVTLPVYSKAIGRAEKTDYLEYFAFREISLSIGRILVLAISFVIFHFLPLRRAFTAIFSVAAVSYIAIVYTSRNIPNQ